MTRIRRVTAVIVVGVLLLGLTGATSAPRVGEGSVSTSLELLSLDLTDVPQAGDLGAALGTLTSRATTVETSAASLLLEALRVGDTTLAPWQADASDDPSSGDTTVTLPAAAGISGEVTLADWLAEAGATSAAARVSALTGGLDVGPLVGLAVELGDRGVSSQVTEDRVTGGTEVSIDGLGLAVGDLLPAGLLDELPLGTLLDLLDQLPLALPADLEVAVAEVEALISELEAIVALDGDVQASLAELLALLEVADLAAAEALVADLADAVAALAVPLADAEAALALLEDLSLLDPIGLLTGLLELDALYGAASGCGDPEAALLADLSAIASCYDAYLTALVGRLTVELADARQTLADAAGPLEDHLALVDDLVALLDDLALLLGDRPDLAELRDRLAGLLGGAQLFDLGRLAIEVEVAADADSASASVTCTATDVAVLGQALLPELSCDVLGETFGALEAVVADLLGALPIGDLSVQVAVGGLRVTTDTASDPEAGVSSAAAGISALRAQVGSVGLEAVLDLLTGQLGDLVGEVGGIADGLGLGGTALGDELTGLSVSVDGLPLGDGLAGLRTVGLDLQVASIDVLGDFAAAQAPDGEGPGGDPGGEGPGGEGPGGDGPGGDGPGGDGPGGDGPGGGGPGGDGPGLDPVPVNAPGTPAPTPPAGSPTAPNLPRTGGGAPAMLLGMALLGAGTILRRVRPA